MAHKGGNKMPPVFYAKITWKTFAPTPKFTAITDNASFLGIYANQNIRQNP